MKQAKSIFGGTSDGQCLSGASSDLDAATGARDESSATNQTKGQSMSTKKAKAHVPRESKLAEVRFTVSKIVLRRFDRYAVEHGRNRPLQLRHMMQTLVTGMEG